jgi:hypothetical protein
MEQPRREDCEGKRFLFFLPLRFFAPSLFVNPVIKVQFDKPRFVQDMRRLAAVTNREMKDVLREQAGFLCADALKLTAPTGNAPMQEGRTKQRQQGIGATTRDIRRVFSPIRLLDFMENDTRFGRAIEKLLRKGNYHMVEALLRRIGFRKFQGVIPEAERDLHDRNRRSRGRVYPTTPPYFVDRTASIKRYIGTRIKKVGYAKSGWMKALRAVGRAQSTGRTSVPGWISSQAGPGIYFEMGSGEKQEIQAGNAVPYMQWAADRILGRAWQERAAKLPMQIRQIERKMQKQLQAAT